MQFLQKNSSMYFERKNADFLRIFFGENILNIVPGSIFRTIFSAEFSSEFLGKTILLNLLAENFHFILHFIGQNFRQFS
jgi:hypothetical protein